MNPREFHPGLPSLSQAAKNYNLVTSDHVPVLANISNKIKIISWNVLATDSANGFAPLGESSYNETEQQTQDRYDRIANGLAKMVAQNAPHFICLQEITCKLDKQSLYSKIRSQLPNYAVIEKDGSPVETDGCFTLYNTKQFKPAPGIEKKTLKDFKCGFLEGNKTDYVSKVGALTVRITNVHPTFLAVPNRHEAAITKYLNHDEANTLSVVVGDFNCVVAPLNSVPSNITTSATVSTYRKNQLQGACAVDGCFYAYNDADNTPAVNQQAPLKHLNPQTGKPYDALSLAPIKVNGLPDLQKNEITRFEMVISIDPFWDTQKTVNGKYTAAEYQDYLQVELKNPSLVVRNAKNLNNENGIGVTLTRDCYQNIKSLNINDPRLSFRVEETGSSADGLSPMQYLVLTSKANMQFLMQQIAGYCNQTMDNYYNTLNSYLELKQINDDYIDHLQQHPSTRQVDMCTRQEKLDFVCAIAELLKSNENKPTAEKIIVIKEIRQRLTKNNDISKYRGPDWAKYLRNMGAVLACIVFPVGATAAIISKVKYNTCQFWETTGFKKREHLLDKISSFEKRLNRQ